MKKYFFLILLLTGCSSIPFQKLTDGVGYTIETKGPANFIVRAVLPKDFEAKSVTKYVARAVGEECAQRGFEYFDYATVVNGTSEGFCFKESKRKALAITFSEKGLNAQPSEFIVESLNQKSKTYLQLNDKIVKANGKDVHSVADIKSLAFDLGQKNVDSVKIELIRQGKPLTVLEPLADMSNGAYGPQDLASLRKKYY